MEGFWSLLIPTNKKIQHTHAVESQRISPFFVAEVTVDSMGWICRNCCAIWWQMLCCWQEQRHRQLLQARLKEAMQQHCCGQSLQGWALRDTLFGCQGVHSGVATLCPAQPRAHCSPSSFCTALCLLLPCPHPAQPCACCCSVLTVCGKGCLHSHRPWTEVTLPSSSGVGVQNLIACFHERENRGVLAGARQYGI